MKNVFLYLLLFLPDFAFSQTLNPKFERLIGFSTKADNYNAGFFFTTDTAEFIYPSAQTYGNELQLSTDHAGSNINNNYLHYNTFDHFGEMGFLPKNRFEIIKDSVSKIVTSTELLYDVVKKIWISKSKTKNYYDAEWNNILIENFQNTMDTLKLKNQRFLKYDIHKNIIFDSTVNYSNNAPAGRWSKYFLYENNFMVQASQMTGNGTMQIWKYYKDSFMYKEHAYLLYPDSSIKFLNEKYQFFDGQGNIIETFYIGKNDGTHDTTNHSISKYVYDDNMNITSRIDKTKDYTGNWVGSLKEDYAYNAENVITENAKYLWNRSNNFWYKYHNSIYEYDSSSKMSKKKYYTSKDSVTWDPINLTTFDYTECNNISHEFFYIWDTLISDFVLGSFKNYYWQKYFYDENTEDTNEDFVSAIYPNPSANYFNLIFESEMAGQGVIEIHDVSGKIIFQENIKVQKQVNNYTWDASNVPSGLYFMNISMGDLHKIMKIVKYP